MKPTFSLLIALVVMLLVACQSDKKPAATQLPTPAPVQPQSQPLNAPVATAGVQHYICPNNCSGSGGAAAGTCPVCGTQYTHNAAFHNQTGADANNQQLAPSPILTNPQQTTTPQQTTVPNPQTQPQPAAEPAQNTAGVWHYICSKGCTGGSGTRGLCAKCGAGMDHNQAYHQ